ncbi:MAG TPA: hypothetical protein DCM48_09295, partial [Thalassospira sp.]|nr:hypothetical protein [Thalassospira sp.]
GGRIQFADFDATTLPAAVVGQRLAYVGADAYLFNGSISDNLFYGLKHRPVLLEQDNDNPAPDSDADAKAYPDPKFVDVVELADPADLPWKLTREMYDEIKMS